MKLEVTHKEIVAGLTQFLASQGISGFDPKTCHVTFSQKRGTGELSAILDTEAPVEEKPAAKPAAAAATPAAEQKAEVQAKEATHAPEPEAQAAEAETQPETPAETQVETVATEGGSDEDNLFD